MKTLTFHRWNSSFHVSSRGEEKHFSCVDPVETILTLFTGSCIDLMSNQCLYRLDHHCICIFFLMPYSIIGTHLVTFHCSNVEKPHLKITSKMNKQYTVFWPLTLRQISSFIGWKLFFLTGETFLFMCQAERKKYMCQTEWKYFFHGWMLCFHPSSEKSFTFMCWAEKNTFFHVSRWVKTFLLRGWNLCFHVCENFQGLNILLFSCVELSENHFFTKENFLKKKKKEAFSCVGLS